MRFGFWQEICMAESLCLCALYNWCSDGSLCWACLGSSNCRARFLLRSTYRFCLIFYNWSCSAGISSNWSIVAYRFLSSALPLWLLGLQLVYIPFSSLYSYALQSQSLALSCCYFLCWYHIRLSHLSGLDLVHDQWTTSRKSKIVQTIRLHNWGKARLQKPY